MNTVAIDQDQLEGIAFVGQTLGPFFSEDPKNGNAASLYAAFATMDEDEAGRAWPFCSEAVAVQALASMRQAIGTDIEGITDEYRRLFVGPGHKVCPPWGSVYTDRDGVIFGVSALDLHDWLSANNVLVDVGDNMPDDHIGRMLSLMAWIAENRPDLLKTYLSEHLMTWAYHFLDLVCERTEHDFFKALARLSSASLKGIEETLELDVVTPRFFR